MSKGHCRKGKEIESWVCNFLKWKRISQLLKVNLRLRQDYLKRRVNWTELNGKDEMLIQFFVNLSDSLNRRGWNSVRRTN